MDYTTLMKACDEALRIKDPHRNYHGRNMAELAMEVIELTHPDTPKGDQELIYYGMGLHDIGKIFITDSLLNKSRRLTTTEFEQIKVHVSIGKIYADQLGLHPVVIEIIYLHHENMDGTGYLTAKKEIELPWYCRLGRVLDVYDALTSRRSYKQSMSSNEALDVMTPKVNVFFDPVYIDALKKIKNYVTDE